MLKPSFHQHPLANDIDKARHRQFMKEALPHLIGGEITALLVYFIYRDFSSPAQEWLWFTGNLILLACTVVFYTVYFRNPDTLTPPQWGKVTFVVAMLWGMCWSLPPFIFLGTDQALYISVMLVIIIALSTSPAPAMVHYPSSYYVFITLPLTALFIKLTTLDVGGGIIMLMLTPFLWVSLLGYGWGLHGTMINGIKLRLENEQAWREAEQANIAKSQFLAAASHDIRQPLQAINLFLSALKNRNRDEQDTQLFNNLEASVDSMSELLNSLLDVSKLDAQVVEAKPDHIALKPLLQKLANELEPLAKDKQLWVEFDSEDYCVYADPILLERVLNNLLTNALRYTEKGYIRLSTRQDKEQIRIEVKDTGIGIPSDEQEAIFNEFYQLANPERDRQKGLGLGLAIVKRLCSLQDWPLKLFSEPGQGSRFSIVVPEGDSKQIKTVEAPSNPDQTLSQLHVLIIDDEEGIRSGLCSLLESWGSQAFAFGDADSACQALRDGEQQPNLIISDYRLRDNRTGVEAIEAIRDTMGNSVEAFLITGDTAPERLQEAKASGLTVLHKPVKPAQLRSVIQRKLRHLL